MKRIIVLVVFILVTGIAFAQSDSNQLVMKFNYPITPIVDSGGG